MRFDGGPSGDRRTAVLPRIAADLLPSGLGGGAPGTSGHGGAG